MNTIPTKHSRKLLKMPSSLLAINKVTRKRSRKRLISNDLIDTFHERYIFTSLADLNKTTAPDSFQSKKSNDQALFYNLVFGEGTKFPKIVESLKVDLNFHFQQQFNSIIVHLPQWFVQGHNARLKNASMLENVPAHIRNVVFDKCNELLGVLYKRQFSKRKERPLYSVEIIGYGLLHLRHTSFQA